jgi:isopenicillin N synthase-like dioxygenase
MACHLEAINQADVREEVADLVTLSYAKLLKHDANESARLILACSRWGFFYLDLEGGEPLGYLENVENIFGVARDYFAQPLELKKRDTLDDFRAFNICGQVYASYY